MPFSPGILLATETNGLTTPIYVVEIVTWRMRGWYSREGRLRRLGETKTEAAVKVDRRYIDALG